MFRYIYITQQSCASKGSRPGAPLATGLVQPAASGLDKPRVADDYKHCSLLTLTFQRNCLRNMFSSAKAEWKWISPGLCDDAGVCHCSAKTISLRWSKQLGWKICRYADSAYTIYHMVYHIPFLQRATHWKWRRMVEPPLQREGSGLE